MRQRQYCYRMLLAVTSVLLLSVAWPPSGVADEETANDNAQTAGQRAYFAQTYCGISPARVGAYKERLRKVLHDASNFDLQWQTGWRRGEKDGIQMDALRLNDPQEFASRVKADCERLKWMAQNAVRVRPQK
ncbi:hypothetical protein B0G75_10839 [Paraburkholderia sp. BL18I3N2]|uniref:hypothetical protein n=1 Tax=Paraburkholderia sp. BL18I3N2 TaxID=1938799 RepID=UPI000D065636|nr:hypothetical protein [Paraburkholderia sp. BL18I3N2]PRX29549.1 hypothetical protein B0G75_10839 [Paraburkholderia sp. BL18I3N2]